MTAGYVKGEVRICCSTAQERQTKDIASLDSLVLP